MILLQQRRVFQTIRPLRLPSELRQPHDFTRDAPSIMDEGCIDQHLARSSLRPPPDAYRRNVTGRGRAG
ncbi:MAG: hypothetical protein ABW026_13175, partial [Microvirga sp.]